VAVQYRLTARLGDREGRGLTENLSERGAMISVELEPPPEAGDELELELELPGVGPVTVSTSVRWASAVLPGMIGAEFEQPVPPELLVHIQHLLNERMALEDVEIV
jgi:hypothetical protein